MRRPLRVLLLVLGCWASGAGGGARAQPPAPTLFDVPWGGPALLADVAPGRAAAARALGGPALEVHLELDLTNPRLVRGRQEVRVANDAAEGWDDLVFHLFPTLLGAGFEIERLTLDGRAQEPRLEADGTRLRVGLEPSLAPGDAAVVALDYLLRVPTDAPRNYGILAYRQGVLSLAHPYALLAARGPGGWDLDAPAPHGDLAFAESGSYRLRVVAPRDWTVAAGGRELGSRDEGDAVARHYVAGPARDLYLAASGRYRTLEGRAGAIRLRLHHLPGQEAAARAALDAAAAALEIFAARYGPYPYRELELAAIETEALGVEFPGLVALASSLLDEGPSPTLERTVAHEVAHQWFYGLVGSDQASEPWLDEALSQYATLRYLGDRYGPAAAEGFAAGLDARWERVGRRAVPIGLPATAYDEREYGAIVYGLGPLVLLRLEERLGEEAFTRLLREYVSRHAFGVATGADLRALLEAGCGCDLGGFFAEWIEPPAP